MKIEEVKDKFFTVLVEELGIDSDEITLNSKLEEDFGADSLDCVELTIRLEEEFNIEIPDEDAEKLVTVSDVLNYLESKIAR